MNETLDAIERGSLRAPRRCRNCRELGHKSNKCPQPRNRTSKRDVVPEFVDPIDEAARLRQRIDALDIEAKSYRDTLEVMLDHLVRNRIERMDAHRAMMAARSRR